MSLAWWPSTGIPLCANQLGLGTATGILYTYGGHLGRLFRLAQRRHEILAALRQRKGYAAGGYQRAFNHAKLITTVLGYAAFGRNDRPNLILETQPLFALLGRSLTAEALDQATRTLEGADVLARGCFAGGVSPVPIYALGSRPGDMAVVQGEHLDDSMARSTNLRVLDPSVEIVPAPDACE